MNQDTISAQTDVHHFIGINVNNGYLFPTNDFVRGMEQSSRSFTSFDFKYGYTSLGNSWVDYAFGMPYWGLGIKSTLFSKAKELGYPITLYVFQGGTIHKITQSVSLNYEWNLGMSFNWKPYDPFTNPQNIAIGSSTNAYVSFIPYVKWSIADNCDLKLGLGLSHFSNGSYKKPNKGVNLYSSFLECDFLPGGKSSVKHINPSINYCVRKRVDYDFMITVSSRQVEFDTLGTSLSSEYVDKNFTVLAVSFAPMIVPNYKYKYGVGLDMFYDESSGAKAFRQYNPADGHTYDRVILGDFLDRFSLGTSAKGEITMPYYSIFANLGYNWIQSNSIDRRLYQIIGIKFYFKDNIYGSFGIRATHFTKATCLYWSLGYTLKGKPSKKCN